MKRLTFIEFLKKIFTSDYKKDEAYLEKDFKFWLVNLTNGKLMELSEDFGNEKEKIGFDKGRKLRDLNNK